MQVTYRRYLITWRPHSNFYVTPPGGLTWREPLATMATAKKYVDAHILEMSAMRASFQRGAK